MRIALEPHPLEREVGSLRPAQIKSLHFIRPLTASPVSFAQRSPLLLFPEPPHFVGALPTLADGRGLG
jgi:hypothetical protein